MWVTKLFDCGYFTNFTHCFVIVPGRQIMDSVFENKANYAEVNTDTLFQKSDATTNFWEI